MRTSSVSLQWPLLLRLLLTITFVHGFVLNSVSSLCDFSFIDNNKLYNYSLASSSRKFPHGVLSEDGFYKVAVNQTVLWFQLCDSLIFNHDPPTCVDCSDCGGPARCGMGCSALLSDKIGGYPICTTIGNPGSMTIDLIDKKKPHKGVTVTMFTNDPKFNCSLSVSVVCDSSGVQEPKTLDKVGTCDYATQLRHPYGCAKIISVHGSGWGWFSTLLIIIFCALGGYLLAGMVYRFFSLGIRGIDVIPNLDFWASLPHSVQRYVMSLVQKVRGPSEGHRSSYSRVNF